MKKRNILTAAFAGLLVASTAGSALGQAPGQAPGEDTLGTVTSEAEFDSPSLFPIVTETGQISLSVDALGTLADRGLVQVDKPANASVRRAFLAAASTGFRQFEIPDNTMLLNGEPIAWDMVIESKIHSYNHWAEVTEIVKDTIDAAPPGIVDLEIVEDVAGETCGTVTELSCKIDGSILAVIFDNKEEPRLNNIVLFFGAQIPCDEPPGTGCSGPIGDNFTIELAEPIYLADPALVLDLSLGISYGFQFQFPFQLNEIDVNGSRLADYAGGQDDGEDANGALITVGGVGDTNANPPPIGDLTEIPSINLDDELYNLIPFVNDGDTSIFVETRNGSRDDNIYFAAVSLAGSHKVDICHIPPKNPDKFHTITVGKNALQAHLAHGDLAGACDAVCEAVCDDENKCTIDDCDPAGGCAPHLPVDCDDGVACTEDSCDTTIGCKYEDNCPAGQECDLETGECSSVGGVDCNGPPPGLVLGGVNWATTNDVGGAIDACEAEAALQGCTSASYCTQFIQGQSSCQGCILAGSQSDCEFCVSILESRMSTYSDPDCDFTVPSCVLPQ